MIIPKPENYTISQLNKQMKIISKRVNRTNFIEKILLLL